ncbi:MAG: TIGR04282 family arsenosugar biosynthesis glycosyltransferase [Chitinophagaceae bacterium]
MGTGAAIIVFVRNPELGKVKTRLAATMGKKIALKIYCFLLKHTYGLVKDISFPVYVYYHDKVAEPDIWNGGHIIKKVQQGNDLGEKMANAFREVFAVGFTKVLIIGSDCYELTAELITKAFNMLENTDIVIGPAKDGGYYLLGMNAPLKNLFQNIEWGTCTVYSKTIEKINQNKYSVAALAVLTDVDTEEDITFSYH